MTVLLAFGTRPEALKLGCLAAEMRNLGNEPFILSSGQHTDLLKGSPAESDLIPNETLGLPSVGECENWVQKAGVAFMAAYQRIKPSIVVVQGDTMSAVAGGLAARMLHIPIAHVEAGIRSGQLDEPYPEEAYRRKITRWASWHFAPTALCGANLASEGVPHHAIFVTGNPIVSAIARYAPNVTPVENPKAQILVTMHRREWLVRGDVVVSRTIRALSEVASCYPHIEFIWPVHPHVEKLADVKSRILPKNMRTVLPMPYKETMETLAESLGVATDSGGLQEEAATLGVPCAVLRNYTDRHESVSLGLAKLFPPDPQGIEWAIRSLASQEMDRVPTPVYGTPDSAQRIAIKLMDLRRFGVCSLSDQARS